MDDSKVVFSVKCGGSHRCSGAWQSVVERLGLPSIGGKGSIMDDSKVVFSVKCGGSSWLGTG